MNRKYFSVNKHGITNEQQATDNFIIYKQTTIKDQQDFIDQYHLPTDIFDFSDTPSIAPRLEKFSNDLLGEATIFVVTNVKQTESQNNSEQRLETHTFIYNEEQLFWFIHDNASNLDTLLFQKYEEQLDTLESILVYIGLIVYGNHTDELRKQKHTIDVLNGQSNQTTKRKILIEIAETERNLVILEHTIEAQESAYSTLLDNEQFIQRLDNSNLLHDIKWHNRQVNKLVHVYRDLLDSVSSLYSDIMSSTLNNLMKFLSSLSLILAATSLVAELWGMNTGGLPFEFNDYGTLIMILVAFSSGLLMYLFLKNKKYFDD